MNKSKFSIAINGFTLAEVLITLGIIGIIAAMTIPTLMQNYQKMRFATAAKKAYSELSQANEAAIAKNGDPSTWDTSDLNNTYLVAKYFFPEMKGTYIDIHSGVYDNYIRNLGVVNKSNIHCYAYNNCAFQATNGEIFIQDWSSRSINAGSLSSEVFVDVNGLEKPNVEGKDIFIFEVIHKTGTGITYSGGTLSEAHLYSAGIFPGGDFENSCGNPITWFNFTCALMLNNWQYPTDFPWDKINPTNWNGTTIYPMS